MKITNSDIIKSGEKELINAVISDIDWGMIREVLRNKYQLALEDGDVEYRAGDIIVHDNQVAYKLDFDVKVTLSVLLNRQGECFDVGVVHSATGAETTSPDVASDTGAGDVPDVDQPSSSPSASDSAGRPTEENAAEAAAASASPPPPVSAPGEVQASKETSPQKDAPTPSQIADMIASINRD